MPESRGFDIPNPGESPRQGRGKNYLLAIGIDQYQHVGKLSNAVRDARMVSGLLEERYGFEERQLLFDGEATRRGIRNVLREQIRRVGKEDNLVIYFSGHGHYDQLINEAYWIPVDARFGDDTDYVSYDYIQKSIRAMDAHHIFLVVDSCYSGAIMVRKRDEPLQRFEKDPSRWILASGRNEVVPDGISGGNSPFATQLLDVLTRYSGEGIRVSELVNKVTTAVIHDSFQTPIGRPLFQVGDKGGEFVFRAKLEEGSFWREVRRGNTVKGYEAYLLQFPTGRYGEEAAWARAELVGTVEGYLDYRNSYQGGKYYGEALQRIEGLEEEADWKYASRRNSIAAYEGYKGKYPSGKYLEEANQRIGKLLRREKPVDKKPPKAEEPKEKMKEGPVVEGPSMDWARWGKWAVGGLALILFLVFGLPPIIESLQGPVDRDTVAQDTTTQPPSFEDTLLSEEAMEPLEEEKQAVVDTESQLTENWQDRYDTVEPLNGGKHIVHLGKKRGYTNAQGEEIIAPKYDVAWEFGKDYEGLAKVRLGGREFYINSRGRETAPPTPPGISISYSRPQTKALTRQEAVAEIDLFMKRISGGSFDMGSNEGQDDEKPIHSVRLSSFSISQFEVTQAQWEAIMEENPSRFSDCPNCPVEKVSWDDVQDFIKKLNSYSNKTYRLPTEAEWEYAAGAGTNYTYAGSNSLGQVGWYNENSGSKTHAVGTKGANGWGLYDMSGNVWEWCSDWYGSDYYVNSPSSNPKGPGNGQYRVLRGGSWFNDASRCRVSYRNNRGDPSYRYDFIGFRLARVGS